MNATEAGTATAPAKAQVPTPAGLMLRMASGERKLGLVVSPKMQRDATLSGAAGALNFSFPQGVTARLVEAGNRATRKAAPASPPLRLSGGRIAVSANVQNFELEEGCALHLLVYDRAGSFKQELRLPLGMPEVAAEFDLVEEAAVGCFAVLLAGSGSWSGASVKVDGVAQLMGDADVAPTSGARASFGRRRTNSVVSKLVQLYQNGFEEQARHDLEDIVFNPATADRKRSDAAFSLAAALSAAPSAEAASEVLELLDIISSYEEPGWMPIERTMLRSEALIALGRLAEARVACVATLARFRASRPQIEVALSNALSEPLRTRSVIATLTRQLDRNGQRGVRLVDPARGLRLDNLEGLPRAEEPAPQAQNRPLVSVIVPTFNAGERITVALRSLLQQSWRNMEILVVDDASSDRTAELVQAIERTDDRVRLIRLQENGGPYVARNAALAVAKGEFVTTHDADDWSHPDKIAYQAQMLLDNEQMVANMSEYLRVDDAFMFQRRGRMSYLGPCLSSFMFRRASVMARIGYWDSVRFGGDAEFIARVERAFGSESVVRLRSGPLTMMHLGPENLTASRFSRYAGFKVGARREYEEASKHWYAQANSLRIDASGQRSFPAPAIMIPSYRPSPSPARADLVLASDFRLTGGTNQSNLQEIRVQKAMGLKTALVQLDRYDTSPSGEIGAAIRGEVDADLCRVVTFGETIECDLLVVRHPPVLNLPNAIRPQIRARRALVIVNEPPKRVREGAVFDMYRPAECERQLRALAEIAGPVEWTPIGPVVRDAFVAAYPDFPLTAENWVNIIEPAEWQPAADRPRGPSTGRKPIVGRHSRDHYTKWPEEKDTLAQAYRSDAFDVHVLGGAEIPTAILGERPPEWVVHEFDAVAVPEFLRELDVFVYFTHSAWDEAFGRVILEALSVGLPVIADRKLERLFGDALIYAEPADVAGIVERLWTDPAAYAERSRRSVDFVRDNFGPEVHARRITALLEETRAASRAPAADCLPDLGRRLAAQSAG